MKIPLVTICFYLLGCIGNSPHTVIPFDKISLTPLKIAIPDMIAGDPNAALVKIEQERQRLPRWEIDYTRGLLLLYIAENKSQKNQKNIMLKLAWNEINRAAKAGYYPAIALNRYSVKHKTLGSEFACSADLQGVVGVKTESYLSTNWRIIAGGRF